jgi:putative transposase
MYPLPCRQHPAHPSPIISMDRPTVIFVTVCVADRRNLLPNSAAHQLLTEAWKKAGAWKVGRYVILPDHVHLFCSPFDPSFSLYRWVHFWRNEFTRQWPNKLDKPIWQKNFWDTQLRRGESYATKWEYVRLNPLRAGLVSNPDDWPYQGELEKLSWIEI